jgi:hypothetical protein
MIKMKKVRNYYSVKWCELTFTAIISIIRETGLFSCWVSEIGHYIVLLWPWGERWWDWANNASDWTSLGWTSRPINKIKPIRLYKRLSLCQLIGGMSGIWKFSKYSKWTLILWTLYILSTSLIIGSNCSKGIIFTQAISIIIAL